MFGVRRVQIRSFEKGLLTKHGEFVRVLGRGRYWSVEPLLKRHVDVSSMRAPWIDHEQLDVMIRSGALKEDAAVLDLEQHQRALVWIDGRLDVVLGPGQYALWTGVRKVRTEVLDARTVRFDHPQLHAVLNAPGADAVLNKHTIEEGHAGVYFKDGEYVETLKPGAYAFWKDVAKVVVHVRDMRESVLDVTGQDIITQDKVTLRVNAVVTFRVTDALKAVSAVDDARQALYREAQLALRAEVGARELDALLADKASLTEAVEAGIRDRAAAYGIAVAGFGIRDIILPGEMRDLMNKVTEAKKAAEANFITRREETAAMRSQANTAKMLSDNPTLMRLRELEVLEKIAATSKLNVVLGEKGLADRVVNLL